MSQLEWDKSREQGVRRIGVQSALMSGESNESGYIRAGNWTVSRDDIATCRRQMMKTEKKKWKKN